MKEILTYLIGVVVCSGLFIAFYRLLLHQRTSFRTARIFLMASLIAAAIIPAFNIPVWKTEPIEIPVFNIPVYEISETAAAPAPVTEPVDYWGIALWGIYGIGIAALLGVMIYQSLKIRRVRRRAKIHSIDGYEIAVSTEVKAPFSFLTTVYVEENTSQDELRQIILHETSHIRHHHSVEKIIMETLKTLMWFNPFAWIASRLLNEVHEFEADRDVLQGGCTVEEYLPVIFKQVFGYIPEISTGLANSLTKKRFEMMTRKLKHRRYSWLRTAGVAPIAAGMLMLFGFTNRAPEIKMINAPEINETVQEPATYVLDAQRDTIWYIADRMPVFQNNGDFNSFQNWVMKNLIFPIKAVENNISGRVTARFVIEKDGRLDNIEILDSPHQVLSDEVSRILKSSPKWTPGKQHGELARVYYVLPVDFNLADDGMMSDEEIEEQIKATGDILIKSTRPDGRTTVGNLREERFAEFWQGGPGNAFFWLDGPNPREISKSDLTGMDYNSIESISIFTENNYTDVPQEVITAIGNRKVDAIAIIKPRNNGKPVADEITVAGYGTRRYPDTKNGQTQTVTLNIDNRTNDRVVAEYNSDNGLKFRTSGRGEPFIWLSGEKREITQEEMGKLDPNHIESISVLKNGRDNYPQEINDAIGDREFEGVIIIELKKETVKMSFDHIQFADTKGRKITIDTDNRSPDGSPYIITDNDRSHLDLRGWSKDDNIFVWDNSKSREIPFPTLNSISADIKSLAVLKGNSANKIIKAAASSDSRIADNRTAIKEAMGNRKFDGAIFIRTK